MIRATVRRLENRVIDTTVGRVILNEHMPTEMPYVNGTLKVKGSARLSTTVTCGWAIPRPSRCSTRSKTSASCTRRRRASRSASTIWSPRPEGRLVKQAQDEVVEVENQYKEGIITNGERYNKVIAIWSEVTENVAEAMFKEMFRRENRLVRCTVACPDQLSAGPRSLAEYDHAHCYWRGPC